MNLNPVPARLSISRGYSLCLAAASPTKVASVEGITEYQLDQRPCAVLLF